MSTNKFRYILIVLFAILLVVELFMLDYSNLWDWRNFIRFPGPILMIIAIIISIQYSNKKALNKYN